MCMPKRKHASSRNWPANSRPDAMARTALTRRPYCGTAMFFMSRHKPAVSSIHRNLFTIYSIDFMFDNFI